MKSMVVLFALCAVACGSLVPLAQPPHHPAVVLDAHGRPLDTAEVIHNRAVHLQAKALEHHAPLVHAAPLLHAAPMVHAAPVAHAVYAAPAAVSHQSRVDVHSRPAVVAHSVHAAPVLGAHSYGHGLLGHGLGHYLKKRSLGHLAYSAPAVYVGGSAVSHQSRHDVISSPAVVAHAVAPVVHAAPVVAHAPVYAHAVPAAVSHQSRVDYRTSPAVVAHSVYAAPLAAWVAPAHGNLLKKRSLAFAHAFPSAVLHSHQSRVDVISSPAVVAHHAAPLAVAHAAPAVVAAPASVSHQSRVDVLSSHVAPVAHHSLLTAPLSYLSHAFHSSPINVW